MSEPLDTIMREWAVVSAAPWSFVAVSIVALGMAWVFVSQINSGTIAAKDATIETLKTQNAAYKEKLGGATPDEAKARIDSLEARIKNIEPRNMSKDQRSILNGALSSLPDLASRKIDIAYYESGCIDCGVYAADFMHLFPSPPWSVDMIIIGESTLASPKGLAVIVLDINHLDITQNIITLALKNAHIDFDLKNGVDDVIHNMRNRPDTIILITPKNVN